MSNKIYQFLKKRDFKGKDTIEELWDETKDKAEDIKESLKEL